MNRVDFLKKSKNITSWLLSDILFYFYSAKYQPGIARNKIIFWKTWPFITIHKMEDGFDYVKGLQTMESFA
jgi:hypothetical protein